MLTEIVKPQKFKRMGMELDKWFHKSCIAFVGLGKDWATLYIIKSEHEGRGHATELCRMMKSYYEKQGLRFGGTVALNDKMEHIYKKTGIKEYKPC